MKCVRTLLEFKQLGTECKACRDVLKLKESLLWLQYEVCEDIIGTDENVILKLKQLLLGPEHEVCEHPIGIERIIIRN